MPEIPEDTILKINNLKKYFPIESGMLRRIQGYVKAVDNVSLSLKFGDTLGLVGESGCGKTTTALTIIRALDPTDGEILFRNNEKVIDIAQYKKNNLKKIRKNLQMIFQDPYSSLNPRMPVLDLIAEPLRAYGWKKKDYEERVVELMELVDLNSNYIRRYPHGFSGGQRQRIGIARALALNPSLVLADEPVSALDVSVQAQILNLLNQLQQKMGLTYLFIAHDLSVIRHICKKIAVMYLGEIVEIAEGDELFINPKHPYTAALISSVPDINLEHDWLKETISGEVPDPSQKPEGCNFALRCRYAMEKCFNDPPKLEPYKDKHETACHLAKELELEGVV